MKNSILVAVIATATMLTACGSKNDSPAAAPAGPITAQSQKDLSNGTWISSCVTRVTSPSLVGAGSEQTRLEFNEGKLDVYSVEFTSADCTGDSKVGGVEHMFISAKSKGGNITADVYNSKVVRTDYNITREQGELFAKIAMVIKDNSLVITSDSALAGTYAREVVAGEETQETTPYMYNAPDGPKGQEMYDAPAKGLPTFGGPR